MKCKLFIRELSDEMEADNSIKLVLAQKKFPFISRYQLNQRVFVIAMPFI